VSSEQFLKLKGQKAMIKCIIFDCDGTLVDSEYLCNLGLEIKLKEYSVSQSAEELMALYKGMK
jgi:beta-phosphoglucomutase-like phosphatase (HAD superfamily)